MIVAIWWMACSGSDDGSSPAPTGAPTDTAVCVAGAELGTGVAHFEPLGTDLTLVHGPQGGWHATAAARWCDLPHPVTVSVGAYWEAEALIVGQSPVYDKFPVPVDEQGCCFEMVDLYTYLTLLDGRLAGPTLDGAAVTLTMTLVDGLGVEHVDVKTVVFHDPET